MCGGGLIALRFLLEAGLPEAVLPVSALRDSDLPVSEFPASCPGSPPPSTSLFQASNCRIHANWRSYSLDAATWPPLAPASL
ncbi:hypothetical protein D3C71_2025660 [compost metagenome]